jgi:hypothetical protein
MLLTYTYHACAHDLTRAFSHALRTGECAWVSYTEIRCYDNVWADSFVASIKRKLGTEA